MKTKHIWWKFCSGNYEFCFLNEEVNGNYVTKVFHSCKMNWNKWIKN